jgi:predicted Zn-dependent protease
VALVSGSIATPLEHTAAFARARVLMDARADVLQRWQRLDVESPSGDSTRAEQFADAYSAALASSLLRDWSRADASIKKALDLALGSAAPKTVPAADIRLPADPRAVRAVLLLATESQLQRGDAPRAQATLARLIKAPAGPLMADATPTSRPVLLLAARIALAMNTSKDDEALRQISEQLQTWVARYPSDPEAWAMLSRVSAQFGWGLRSLRADAESHYAMGDLRGAIDRLRAGQNLARSNQAMADFVESSVIDSRLRTIEAQRRQLLTEQLGYQ